MFDLEQAAGPLGTAGKKSRETCTSGEQDKNAAPPSSSADGFEKPTRKELDWDIHSDLFIGDWKKWHEFIRTFLRLHQSKLNIEERSEAKAKIAALKGAIANWNATLHDTFRIVEDIATKGKAREFYRV